MISFKEFLESQESRLRGEQEAAAEAWRGWSESITALLERIGGWIKESDPHNLVTLNHGSSIDVEGDGIWRQNNPLPKLDIQLGDRAVLIRPIGRDILGPRWKPGNGRWLGRVDLFRADDPERYQLFRFVAGADGEEWYIRDPRDLAMKPLDRASFDAAIVGLFS